MYCLCLSGAVRSGLVCLRLDWRAAVLSALVYMIWPGRAWNNLVLSGLLCSPLVWCGLVRSGLVWSCLVSATDTRRGPVFESNESAEIFFSTRLLLR